MSEKFSLKDHLFHRAKIERLAQELGAVLPEFPQEKFVDQVVERFPELELKARIDWIRQCLRPLLPEAYPEALNCLLRALPPPCDPERSDDDFGEFLYAPYGEFVASYGCNREWLEISLEGLRQITCRFSAEYAIRPFLKAFPQETLSSLQAWTLDPHYHVRRLCSEGTRPKLPWAMAVSLKPEQTLPLLDLLHADSTRFVTRSLANHLNDLSKSHPDLVLQRLQQWRAQARQQKTELDYMEKHALRSLIKLGHPGALEQLGFAGLEFLKIEPLQMANRQVRIGQALEFEVQLMAEREAQIVVDYKIEFQSRRGKLENRKTFKLKNLSLQTGESVRLSKRHPFKANMTTRQLYPGLHRLTLLINGSASGILDFHIVE